MFYPEEYGAVGDGVADDTSAVQDAVDAAIAAGGGTVKLTQSYVISKAGSIVHLGLYPTDYGVWVNGDNVHIQGPGTLILAAKPDSTKFSMLLFGNGGNDTGSPPLEAGTWTYNVGVEGVTFDGSAVSLADRTAISGTEAATVNFAYCSRFYARYCTFLSGWGHDGTLRSHSSSRYGQFIANRLIDCGANLSGAGSIAMDGGRYAIIAHNYIENSSCNGILVQHNGDNRESGRCFFVNTVDNIINGYARWKPGRGILYNGVSDGQIALNRTYYTGDNYADCDGILVIGAPSAVVDAMGDRVSIVGNYLYTTAINSVAIEIYGNTAESVTSKDHFISGNIAKGTWSTKLSLGEETSPSHVDESNEWGAVSDFTDGDDTPSIADNSVFQTANTNPTTITMLDDGYVGKRVTVLIQDADTTIDFTGTNLKGNAGADWNPDNGDYMVCTFDGTDWYCQVVDAT